MPVNFVDMRPTIWVLTIALLGASVGCARTSPFVDNDGVPLVEGKLKPNSTEAVLCVYRPFKFFAGLASPLIMIDGRPRVLLHNAGYTYLALSPGTHSIWPAYSEQWVSKRARMLTRGGPSVDLEVQAGQSYYIKVVPQFSIQQESAETAERVLRDLHYLKPIN